MARPKKVGLDYFPFDVNLDDEFRALEELHGNDGFVWLVKFWQSAYKTADGVVDLKGIHGVLASKTARISLEKQEEIIRDCLALGLLETKGQDYYTSVGIQKRLSVVNDKREKDRKSYKKELSDSFPGGNPVETGESKGKEIKEKKTTTAEWFDPKKHWITIAGANITWAFRQQIINFVKDKHLAGLIFYRCAAAWPKNPVGWIRGGFKPPDKYCFKPCKDEENGASGAVQAWLDKHWYPEPGEPVKIGDIIKNN